MGYGLQIDRLSKKVKVKGKEKYLLSNVNLTITKNTLVALVGFSGAGKTTLLNILSGYDKNASGSVFYEQYDLFQGDFKKDISYVPQREILHNDLTLYRELWYTAKLRLGNLSKSEMHQKIHSVIEQLELTGKEKTLIKHLSGGEKRRLSIALELLVCPNVLILDEPTSGLDLNIEKKVMTLLRKIADNGTTVILSAHTVSNLDLCDEIIFMGQQGKICYTGSYQDAFTYFDVQQFVDIYEILTIQTDVYHERYIRDYQSVSIEVQKKKIQPSKNKHLFSDIFLLSKRYLEIIKNDKFLLFMLIFQGGLISFVINCAVPKDGLLHYDSAKIVLFATSCAALWLGLFNSIQEIVKEKNILKREYMFGLKISSYVISKVLVLSLICMLQAILFIGISFAHFEYIDHGLIFNWSFIDNVIQFFFVSFSSCMMGLLISSIVKKQELTLIIAILYMMFQLVFSGVLLKLMDFASQVSYFVFGRYAMQGFGSISNLIDVVYHTKLSNGLNEQVTVQLFLEEAQEYYTYTVSHLGSIWLFFLTIGIVFVIATILVLRKVIKK